MPRPSHSSGFDHPLLGEQYGSLSSSLCSFLFQKLILRVIHNKYKELAESLGMLSISCQTLPLDVCLCARGVRACLRVRDIQRQKVVWCGIHIVHLNASKAMIITAILLAACWTSQKEYSNGKYSTSLAGSLPPYPQEVTQRWKILLPVNLFPYLRNASRDSAAWST